MGKAKGAEQVEWAGGFGQRRRPAEGVLNPSWNKRSVASIMFREGQHAKHAQPRDDNIKDGTEDANHNGKIDGDNGDGIYGESEIWVETDPNSWDTDQDSIRDNKEIEYGYDPLSDDTDGDGLNETEEDVDGDGELDSEETNPKEIDTDDDGLDDKKEKEGWNVIIIDERSCEIIENIIVNSDPRDNDTDNDKLNDYEEWINNANPKIKDSDDDGIDDYNEVYGRIKSSPTGIDGIPPEITKFECHYDGSDYKGWGKIKIPTRMILKISIEFIDNHGISYVNIHIDGLNDIFVKSSKEKIFSEQYEWSISGYNKVKNAIFNGFRINISSMDINGNLGFRNEKQNSISEIVIDNIIGVLDVIVMAIKSIVDIFKNIYDLVSDIINDALDKINGINKKEIVNIGLITLMSLITSDAISYLVDLIIENILGICNFIVSIIVKIVMFLNRLPNKVIDLIYDDIKEKFDDIINLFLNKIFSEIISFISENTKTKFDINSIIPNGIIDFIKDLDLSVKQKFPNIKNDLQKVNSTQIPDFLEIIGIVLNIAEAVIGFASLLAGLFMGLSIVAGAVSLCLLTASPFPLLLLLLLIPLILSYCLYSASLMIGIMPEEAFRSAIENIPTTIIVSLTISGLLIPLLLLSSGKPIDPIVNTLIFTSTFCLVGIMDSLGLLYTPFHEIDFGGKTEIYAVIQDIISIFIGMVADNIMGTLYCITLPLHLLYKIYRIATNAIQRIIIESIVFILFAGKGPVTWLYRSIKWFVKSMYFYKRLNKISDKIQYTDLLIDVYELNIAYDVL